MTERKPQGMTFETWVEQQIRRAHEEGAFEGLSLTGKPLPRRAREKTSYEWALEWARREEADVAAMLPTGLALRKEREELPALIAQQSSEVAVRALVQAHNERVDQYYRRPVDGVLPQPDPGVAVDLPAARRPHAGEHGRAAEQRRSMGT